MFLARPIAELAVLPLIQLIFGGQFLVVIPAHRIVGVINSWNVFGQQVPGALNPLIDALLTAAGVPAQPADASPRQR